MHFPTDVNVSHLPTILGAFLDIVGWKEWEKRGKELKLQFKQNPLLGDYFLERHLLEFALFDLIAYRRTRGKLPKHIRSAAEYQLASFMAAVVGIYRQVNQAGRNRLAGMLRHGLKDENGLLSLQHEMSMAAHFIRHGFDIEPIDITQDGGVDFLVRKDQIEAEVECKLVTADIGRKVHRKRMVELSWVMVPALKLATSSMHGGFIVVVQLPDRLTGKRSHHEEITAAVVAAAAGGVRGPSALTGVSTSVIPFDMTFAANWFGPDRTIDVAAMRQFVDSKVSDKNREIFAYGNNDCVFVVVVGSAKRDDIAKGIYQQLKSAAEKQFSKTKPGVLAVRLTDITPEQLESFGVTQAPHQSPNLLQLIATRLLENPKRAFLHTIAFMVTGPVERSAVVVGKMKHDVVTSSGPCYVFRNSTANLTSDQKFFPGG